MRHENRGNVVPMATGLVWYSHRRLTGLSDAAGAAIAVMARSIGIRMGLNGWNPDNERGTCDLAERQLLVCGIGHQARGFPSPSACVWQPGSRHPSFPCQMGPEPTPGAGGGLRCRPFNRHAALHHARRRRSRPSKPNPPNRAAAGSGMTVKLSTVIPPVLAPSVNVWKVRSPFA